MKTKNHFNITWRGNLTTQVLLLSVLLLAASGVAHAIQCAEGGPRVWSNPATWNPAGVPGAGASVELIDCGVFLDIPVTVANLTLGGSGNGGALTNSGGNSLTVTNRFEINTRGEISSQSPMAVVIPANGTLVFSGPTPFRKNIGGAVTIHNAGRIEWSGGPVYFDGVLNNAGVFVILGDAGFGTALRTGVINNTGTIKKEAGNGTTQFSGFTPETNSIATWIHNQGVVEVASGTMEMGRGTSVGGEFKVAADKTLLISDGHTFDEAIFTGAGTCSLKGTMTFLGHINSTANLELVAGGGITAGDTTRPEAFLEGSGRLIWKGGRITGNFIVTEQVRTVLTGPDAKVYDGPVTNQGTMDWFGPGPLASGASTFRNEGTFNVLAAGTFLADTGTSRPTFENVGTLNTFPGGTSETSDTLILNSGLVNIGGFGHAGILHVNSYEQTVTGTLYMEIGGANAATPQFDQLTGSSTINGNLTVDVINDYTPPTDARFVLMNGRTGQFFRVVTPGGSERSRIEYPGQRCELVSLGDAPIAVLLWGAGRDLARNESPDRAGEAEPINQTVPQWSYGYRTTAASTALTLFTPQQHINDASGLHGWIGPGQATLGVNTKGNSIVFNSGSGDYKPLRPSQIYLSPGSGHEFLVARWTAPANGDYRVVARWADLDNHGGNGATAHLVRNGQEEFVQTFESTDTSPGRARLRARTLSLNAGDTLDFVLGSNGDHLFDATAFNAAVRRVPKVTITSPASGTQLTGAQDVTFNVNVEHLSPGSRVTLTIDDVENTASDPAAPYSLTARLRPGYHRITAVATDPRKAKSESPEIVVIVAPGTVAGGEQGDGSPAGPTTGRLFFSSGSGSWNDPATWGNQGGVPLRWDYAVVQIGHHVTLDLGIQVRDVTVIGRLSSVSGAPVQYALDVYGTLHATGQIDNLDLFINGPAGKFLILGQSPVLRSVNIFNQSKCVITADSFNGEGVIIETRGSIYAGPTLTSEGPLNVPLDGFTQRSGATVLRAGTVLRMPAGAAIEGGTILLSPGQLISDNGAALLSEDGGGFVSEHGGALIGLDGGTLIGLDGGTLIGLDGGTLVGPDGAPLIGLDGGTLIGNDGGTIHPSNAGTAPTGGTILLTGGTIIGIGELRGPVVNQGAFIVPGHSAGGIVVNGDYTQQAGGNLVLETGGRTVFPFTHDIFQVAGTANLGGNLVVKTINGYTPASGDSITPLRYASRTGSFANVSSNAQITLGPTGGQVSVTGSNPPAPKALNISTRMRVETGDNVLIAGFIITGSQPKRVIVRGIGPSLPFAGVLANPTLNLDNGTVTNDNWRTTQEQEIIGTGLQPSHDQESAIVATLSPGPHTAILGGSGGTTGIGIVEVYDLESGSAVQLANIASRGLVQTGDNVMIGGFIIAGTYPTTMIVRAIGPSLPLAGKLEDPTLELVDQNGGRLSNDNWRATHEAEIMATIPPTNDNEAAIIATLAPGNYTVIVRGQEDTTGIAVVEAYNLQ